MDSYNISSCRLCLSPHSLNINIFSPECISNLIPQKILCMLSIMIHPNDCLPQLICPSCLDNVKRLYKFYRTVSYSTSHLISFFEKGDDVAKNIYSNMIKTYQMQNLCFMTEEGNYEDWMSEKYKFVYNAASELILKFSSSEKSIIDKNEFVPNSNKSISNNQINRVPVKLSNNTMSEINSIPKSPVNRNKSPKKSTIELEIQEKVKTLPNITTKTAKLEKTTTQIPSFTQSSSKNIPNQSIVSNVKDKKCNLPQKKKIAILKIHRCKYCECMNNDKRKILCHESLEHNSFVKLNKYYGPECLFLQDDYINQIKKLSWPFRRKRTNKISPNKEVTPSDEFSLVSSDKVHSDAIKSSFSFARPASKKKSLDNLKFTFRKTIKDQNKTLNNLLGRSRKSMNLGLENHSLEGRKKLAQVVLPQSVNNTKFDGIKSHAIYFDSKCKFCSCTLDDISSKEYLKHLNQKGCNSSSMSCPFCREDFSMLESEVFLKHKNLCFTSMDFPKNAMCSKCNKFVERSVLENHQVQEHQILFICFICSAPFNEKDDLLNHLENCNFKPVVNKTFTCIPCEQDLPSLKDYHIHCILEHTGNYLNSDLDLNFNDLPTYEISKKPTDILAPYKIDKYIRCNSKGNFFCGINNCKKVMTDIFKLETHIQKHFQMKMVKCKKTTKKKYGKRKLNEDDEEDDEDEDGNTTKLTGMMSISDTYKYINELQIHEEEEEVELDPKRAYFKYFGLKPNPNPSNELCLEDLFNKYDLDFESDPLGVFELSGSINLDNICRKSPEIVILSDEDE